MIRYIEHKTGFGDHGPAWVARVRLSKSGRTVYFNGLALKPSAGQGIEGNYYDLLSGDEYWVSGVKKKGGDRRGGASGDIQIEASAVSEYLSETGQAELDATRFRVVPDLPPTDPSQFHEIEHKRLHSSRGE